MKHLLLLIILSWINLYSQQLSNPEWKNYLNSESVQAIAEEGEFLWIGSQAGLTKLNKNTYEKEFYNKANTILPTNIIFDIKVDHLGYKWVATFRGLIKFKDDYWILYDTTNSGIPKNEVRTIEIDSLGNIWIGTRGGGIGKFDGINWEVFNTSNSNLPSDMVNDLEFENNNILWIGTTGGLVKKEGINWTVFNTSNSGLTVDNVYVIKIDINKNKWIGVVRDSYMNNSGGVFKFDNINWTNFMPTRPNRIYNAVYYISIDDQNNKWIAANYYGPDYGGGIFLIDSLDNSIQALNINLPLGWVNKIYIDSQNVKWFGTNYGFAKHDQVTETIEISNSKLGHNAIFGLQIDKQTNKKYFSAYGDIPLSGIFIPPGFFSIFTDTSWYIYDWSNSPFLFGVSTFTLSSKGDIYAANYNGFNDLLYKYDGENWNLIPVPVTQYDQILYLFWDNEKLWVYFEGNILFQYYNNIWTEILGSPVKGIRQIIKLNNTYWFVCGNGLAKYEDSTWTLHTSSNSCLPHNSVRSLVVDKLNNLWIGTYDGLAKFDGTNWTIFNSENSPLIYDNITALVCDDFNKIYIGTDYGLFKKDGDNWKFFDSYNSGLPNSYATVHGYFLDYNHINALAVDTLNNIWIATEGGVGVYDEDGIPLPVELTSFTASVENNSVLLDWTTASELNNKGFEIQRKTSSTDWQTIGYKAGNGTTTQPQYYSFEDDLSNVRIGKISYRLKQIDLDGKFKYSETIEIKIGPKSFSLEQNYPNPFNPSTVISYQLPVASKMTLKVYDVLGNEVATLANEEKPAGSYEVEFKSSVGNLQLASGIYYYQLRAGDYVETKKMILMK